MQVGLTGGEGGQRRQKTVAGRKVQRKAERALKKVQRRSTTTWTANEPNPNGLEVHKSKLKRDRPAEFKPAKPAKYPAESLKPILKRSKQYDDSSSLKDGLDTHSSSPKTSSHRSIVHAAEDAEIARLERKLGIKVKKKKSTERSGDGLLAEVFSHSDDEDEAYIEKGKKRKRPEDQDWLGMKRRKATGVSNIEQRRNSKDDDDDDPPSSEDEIISWAGSVLSNTDSISEHGIHSSEEEVVPESKSDGLPSPQERVRENPYLPPKTSSSKEVSAQYVPPALRAPAQANPDYLSRLRRQSQGLLNRLSEANLVSLISEVEQLYRIQPRQHVTSTFTDLLIGLICDRSALSDAFLILHGGFIAALNRIIGMDVGAFFLQRLVETADKLHDSAEMTSEEAVDMLAKQGEKGVLNLLALLSELYNLHVVGATVIFDYIRLLLDKISETNTELLLRILRSEYDFWVENASRNIDNPQVLDPSYDKTIHLR